MRIAKVLVVCAVLSGCADSEQGGANLPIQNVGLQALGGMSGTPPLGEAVVPIAGYPGTAGSPVVTSVGGWSTGPGAITWHGGPWVMPYSTPPGSSLQNVSCDVVPNATSTDLVELVSSNGQVLGSNTVPAVTGVTIRIWIILSPGHAVIDGEQLVLRHTPRDSTTGAWTSAAQDLTILGCAVHTVNITTIPLAATVFLAEDPTAHPVNYLYGPVIGPSFGVRGSVPVPVGHQITAVRATIQDNASDVNARMNLQLISINTNNTNVIASSQVSAGNGTMQTLTLAPQITVAPHTAYFLHVYALGVPSAEDALWFAEVDYN